MAQGAKVELFGGQAKLGTALFRPMILSNIKPNQRAYVRIRMDQGESIVWQGWRRLNQLIPTTKTS